MRIFQPIITGSIDVLGAITALSFTGSLQGTASYALSSSHALNAISTSYAQTASYADTFIVGGDITGSNALFTGTVTAQKLVIQTISSSVVYSSGSNVFGNDLSNTQVITGSVNITGSLVVNNSLVILSNQTSSMSVLSASYADNSTSASYADNAISSSYANNATSASHALNADNATSASYAVDADNAISSSHALNADNAISASYAVNSTSASYAENSTSASYAQNAESASFITGSGVKGAVALAITASYADDANNATSASYAFNSTTASYSMFAATASYSLSGTGFPYSGSAEITGSLLVSGGFITGDLIGTASYALYALNSPTSSLTTLNFSQSIAATTWSFNHNLDTRYPIVQVYDTSYKQIIPNDIVGVSLSTVEIRFDYAQDGYAVISNGSGNQIISGSTSILNQTSAATTWSFNHNLNSKYVTFEVYDSNDFVIYPSSIKVLDNNNAELTFVAPTTGKTIAQFSGITGLNNATSASYALSASYAETSSYATNFTIDTTLDFAGTLTDYASVNSSVVGSNNLFTQATGSYTSAFFKYTVSNGSNTRAGEIIAAWNSSATEFTDFSTVDLGTTNDVTSSISLVGGEIQFNIQTNSSGWKIKSIGTFI